MYIFKRFKLSAASCEIANDIIQDKLSASIAGCTTNMPTQKVVGDPSGFASAEDFAPLVNPQPARTVRGKLVGNRAMPDFSTKKFALGCWVEVNDPSLPPKTVGRVLKEGKHGAYIVQLQTGGCCELPVWVLNEVETPVRNYCVNDLVKIVALKPKQNPEWLGRVAEITTITRAGVVVSMSWGVNGGAMIEASLPADGVIRLGLLDSVRKPFPQYSTGERVRLARLPMPEDILTTPRSLDVGVSVTICKASNPEFHGREGIIIDVDRSVLSDVICGVEIEGRTTYFSQVNLDINPVPLIEPLYLDAVFVIEDTTDSDSCMLSYEGSDWFKWPLSAICGRAPEQPKTKNELVRFSDPEPADQLLQLKTDIGTIWAEVVTAGETRICASRAELMAVRELAEKLIAAKKLVAHGEWELWRDEHVAKALGVKGRQIENYMRLGKPGNWDFLIDRHGGDISNLTLTEALGEIRDMVARRKKSAAPLPASETATAETPAPPPLGAAPFSPGDQIGNSTVMTVDQESQIVIVNSRAAEFVTSTRLTVPEAQIAYQKAQSQRQNWKGGDRVRIVANDDLGGSEAIVEFVETDSQSPTQRWVSVRLPGWEGSLDYDANELQWIEAATPESVAQLAAMQSEPIESAVSAVLEAPPKLSIQNLLGYVEKLLPDFGVDDLNDLVELEYLIYSRVKALETIQHGPERDKSGAIVHLLSTLTQLPADDMGYSVALENADMLTIQTAIDQMTANPRGHKTRLAKIKAFLKRR